MTKVWAGACGLPGPLEPSGEPRAQSHTVACKQIFLVESQKPKFHQGFHVGCGMGLGFGLEFGGQKHTHSQLDLDL